MDELNTSGAAVASAPLAAPSGAPEAPATPPGAPIPSAQPQESLPTSPSVAEQVFGPGGANVPPATGPAPSAAEPPVWQQQLGYVHSLAQALDLQEAAAKASINEIAAIPGITPEQVETAMRRYEASARERAEAKYALQLARVQLERQAERAALEPMGGKFLVMELAELAQQVAPDLDVKDFRAYLQRFAPTGNGDALVIAAQDYVDRHRRGALKQRAATGVDVMSPQAPVAAPARTLSPNEKIQEGLRRYYTQGA